VSSTTLVVICWLITVTIQLTSTRLVVRQSADDTHGIAAHCAIVVPSATIRPQKNEIYAIAE